MSRLRWIAHVAAVAALGVLAFAVGDFATDPNPTDLILLVVAALVVGWCLSRLYRPGGLASFSAARPRDRAPAAPETPRSGEPAKPPTARPARRPGVGMPFADDSGGEPERRLWSR